MPPCANSKCRDRTVAPIRCLTPPSYISADPVPYAETAILSNAINGLSEQKIKQKLLTPSAIIPTNNMHGHDKHAQAGLGQNQAQARLK